MRSAVVQRMRLLFVYGVMGPVEANWTGSLYRGASPEIPPSWLLIGHWGVARWHFLPVPKDCPFAPETCYYLTVCRFWEKVIIADCWKVSYHVNPHHLESTAINTEEQDEVCSVRLLTDEPFSSVFTLLTCSQSDWLFFFWQNSFSVFQITSLF